MLLSVKKSAIAGLTVLSLVAATLQPAEAWGRREQDTLIGALGAVAIGSLFLYGINNNRKGFVVQPRPVRQPDVYVAQPRINIYSTPSAYGFNTYSASQRRIIQTQLSRAGYYHSSIDGAFGPGTYNAVNAYAAATGQSARLSSTAGVYAIYDGLLY